MQLHNRVNRELLKQQLEQEQLQRSTISFYKYAKIDEPQTFRDELYRTWMQWKVLGRVHVATEGINAQISVPDIHFEEFKNHLYSIDFLNNCRLNKAVEDNGRSFIKLKIKVRPKIVSDGLNDDTFDVTDMGQHVNAEQFNQLAEDPDTLILDMRNHYESEIGHFENAVCPDVDTFRDSLPIIEDMLGDKKDKKLLMYCTGGIRCEKASAYFKHKGFQNVFQLDGGIIQYAKQVQEKGLDNKFVGKNFVFDDRLAERISDQVISHCHQCGQACDTHVNCANVACNILFIQCPHCAAQYEHCCGPECQSIIHLPEAEQEAYRKQHNKGRVVYKKGRLRPRLGALEGKGAKQ